MNTKFLLGVLFITLSSVTVESRRVNVKSAAADSDDDPTALPQQTAADDEPTGQFKPVLVARRPLRPLTDGEGERQQPVVVIRQSPRTLQQRPRADQPGPDDDQELASQHPQDSVVRQPPPKPRGQQSPVQQQLVQQRFKEPPTQQQQKEPTAQTIRNYNKLNDDGSFTFGYEADDGSFKEETRGTDCVVRGKYGYVDPDGNKREFSYVQGNPCDPSAPSEDEDEQQQRPGEGKPDEEENVPANVPRPKPAPKKNRPTTTLFQQTFGDFEQPQSPRQPQPQPSTTPRPPGHRLQQQQQEQLSRRPPQISPVQQTDRRPASTASPQPPTPAFRPSIPAPSDELESAIRNLPQPSSLSAAGGKQQPAGPNSPLYTTELVFDPSTGQYNTVVFQQVPKQSVGINVNQRLPPSAPARQPQPQFQPHSPPQFQPQPQFRPALQQPFQQPQFQPQRPAEFDFQRPAAFPPAPTPGPQQQFLQQQQALTFQQSQNLFRQQQKLQHQQQQQQQQQPFQPQSAQFFPPPSQRFAAEQPQFAPPKQQRFEPQPEAHQQQFVLVQPGRTPGQQNLAAGQIDAFLRGHNVQF